MASGGSGGLAQGGAIAGILETYAGSVDLNISSSSLIGDAAIGGAGGGGAGNGGDGGDAQGGAIFASPSAFVALSSCSITANQADGGWFGFAGSGGENGTDGTGIGGGVYLSAAGSTSSKTTIFGNSASTSNDNVYGTFSCC